MTTYDMICLSCCGVQVMWCARHAACCTARRHPCSTQTWASWRACQSKPLGLNLGNWALQDSRQTLVYGLFLCMTGCCHRCACPALFSCDHAPSGRPLWHGHASPCIGEVDLNCYVPCAARLTRAATTLWSSRRTHAPVSWRWVCGVTTV